MKKFLVFFSLLFSFQSAVASPRSSVVASRLGFNTLTLQEYGEVKNVFMKEAKKRGLLKKGENEMDFYLTAAIGCMQESYKMGFTNNQEAFDGCIASYLFSDENSRDFMKEELTGCGEVMGAIEDVYRNLSESEGKSNCCVIL
ncbi:MAG: hypothetical protein LBB13_02585 [Rickettsiales bacterium]|jgi:hypothetical protein|nr:hypothetical protein [Rickettsiales bacterium]